MPKERTKLPYVLVELREFGLVLWRTLDEPVAWAQDHALLRSARKLLANSESSR